MKFSTKPPTKHYEKVPNSTVKNPDISKAKITIPTIDNLIPPPFDRLALRNEQEAEQTII